MEAKATKAAVDYTDDGTEREHCSICTHFIQGGACKIVAGRISPKGWCKRFELPRRAA